MGPQDYAFHWNAELTDGTIIRQFDSEGKEHSFSEVQDKEDSLVYFWLELQESPEPLKVGVSLVDGCFNINDFVIHPLKDDKPWVHLKPEFRVINFRRIRQHFDGELEFKNLDMDYFIGWQTTYDGKNYKKLLAIDSQGNWWMS